MYDINIQINTHHNILRVGIIRERAVIKHDLVEGLRGDLCDSRAVVTQVLVFGDHCLAQGEGWLARSLVLAETGRGQSLKLKYMSVTPTANKQFFKSIKIFINSMTVWYLKLLLTYINRRDVFLKGDVFKYLHRQHS